MKTPKYLHVVLKNETVRRFDYVKFDFKLNKEFFIVAEVETNIVRFATPRENLMYFECNDDEYITKARRYY